MDAKRTITKFIKPSTVTLIVLAIVPPFFIIFSLIYLLATYLPNNNRAKKCLAKLEAESELEKAAAELISANAKRLVKGKVVLTDHYVFLKGTGLVLKYDEVLWVYKHRLTQRVLLIPIKVTDSLYMATSAVKKGKVLSVASMGKDKKEEIKDAIVEIYRHNQNCLIGYTNENVAKHKEMIKK